MMDFNEEQLKINEEFKCEKEIAWEEFKKNISGKHVQLIRKED